MSCDIVLGGQWGDEGKAKMVDFLSQKYEIVCRYQGGANAGHTVEHQGKKHVFHLLPSGILNPNSVCVLGNGMAIDLNILLQEIEAVEAEGIPLKKRLKISSKAFLVLDYHLLLDRLREKKTSKIGTTVRGIGPTYGDKITRTGIRVGDLYRPEELKAKITHALLEKETLIRHFFLEEFPFKVEEIISDLLKKFEKIKPYITDTTYYLNRKLKENKILLEGAQGTGLDIDFGSYPYVTSSSTTSGGACTGTGIPPVRVAQVYGVFKAYITRVGGGALPTALAVDEMNQLRKKGGEFGATTGRSRSCGWFDGVQAKYSVMVNGLTGLAVTKLDILTGYPTIKFCTHYKIDGSKTDVFPDQIESFESAQPVYQEFPGWEEDILGVTNLNDIPKEAKQYLAFLEDYLECKIKFLSTGPERNQIIVL